jgi:hypothetical protein
MACSGSSAGPSGANGGAGGESSTTTGGSAPDASATGGANAIEAATVFGFSQVGLTERDPQLFELAPDVVIRGWAWWDTDGHHQEDYDFSYVQEAHAANILFTGGGTASVFFRDEVDAEETFQAWVSRDSSGAIPARTTPPILYRATLANPAYRKYLVDAAKIQIDGGVDAIFFDELNGSYSGATYDGDEGYDDLQIGDFNAFLLNRYPASTDFSALFGMNPDNILRRDVPPNDIDANFNYRKYLAGKSGQNPLAPLWGTTISNFPDPDATSFIDTVLPNVYWKDIADQVRAYARDTYGRKVLLTSNGIFPYTDFQSVGLYDYNHHLPNGNSVDYVPVTNGHLDGRTSLQSAFRMLKARSDRFSPGAPVVLFIDWPGPTMDRYVALPAPERNDYWRLYAAEAYANGLFFAFHLKTTTGEPSAAEAGTLEQIKALAGFYRGHAELYHGVTAANVNVSGLPASTMVSVMNQALSRRRIVHLVNHEYAAGFTEQKDLTVVVPAETAPSSVQLVSPDQVSDRAAEFSFADGQATIKVPSLLAYDALVITE